MAWERIADLAYERSLGEHGWMIAGHSGWAAYSPTGKVIASGSGGHRTSPREEADRWASSQGFRPERSEGER